MNQTRREYQGPLLVKRPRFYCTEPSLTRVYSGRTRTIMLLAPLFPAKWEPTRCRSTSAAQTPPHSRSATYTEACQRSAIDRQTYWMTYPINEYAQNEIDILSVSPEVEHLCPRILRIVAALRRLVCKEDPMIATGDGTSCTFLAAQTMSGDGNSCKVAWMHTYRLSRHIVAADSTACIKPECNSERVRAS